jgi:hypothetical protein
MLVAVMSFFVVVVTSGAGAASMSKSPGQAQKLAKALKACKKQPTKKKRAACVKRAKTKYAPQHHSLAPLPGPATTPAPPITPVTPVTPPAGPVAPTAITQAEVLRLKCYFSYECAPGHEILNLTILERGTPRLGTGTRGDNIRETTWIFPLLVNYDEFEEKLGRGPCSTEPEPFCEKYTLDHHFEERINRNTMPAAHGTWAASQPKAP